MNKVKGIIAILFSLVPFTAVGLITLLMLAFDPADSVAIRSLILLCLYGLAISTIPLSLGIFNIYTGLRYLKNRPYKKDVRKTLFFSIIGVAYFIFTTTTYLTNNHTGINPGGELQPIIGFIWMWYFTALGFLFI